MAELIGATLGGGNVYDKRPSYVEDCGNPATDKYYFEHILLPIVSKEIGYHQRLFVRDLGLRFRTNRVSFVQWLKQVGIPAGEAKGMAEVPELVNANRGLMVRCVRGIHDTDGSVYFDMRPAYVAPYPRLEPQMKNVDLVSQVSSFFRELGIKHSYVATKDSIETAGVDALGDFLRLVGSSSLHHIKRISKYHPELAEENCCPTNQP